MSKRNYSFNRIDLINYDIDTFMSLLERNMYSDENGLGLIQRELDEDTLCATLLKRNSTYVNKYDAAIGRLEKMQIELFVEIVFFIDFANGLLSTVGQANNLTQVKAYLRTISGGAVTTTPIEITPYKIYSRLKARKQKFLVEELCIDQFNYNNIAIGRFSARITDAKACERLIDEYKESCAKIIISLREADMIYRMTISSNGAISISADDSDDFDNLYLIEKTIL